MLIKGITITQAERAAMQTGVALYSVEGVKGRGWSGVKCVLRPLDRDTYRAVNVFRGAHRRKWAVCWHGHREFMRRVFEINPAAEIKSCVARYRGREEFEQTHGATGDLNAGNRVYYVAARDMCDCQTR